MMNVVQGYAFSGTDLQCCITQIHDFIDEYDEPPYRVMLILCGDINYGGRVTDDKVRCKKNSHERFGISTLRIVLI